MDALDAPFYPDANRRGLDLENPLNDFLLDSVADLCLAVARTIADSDTNAPAMSAAAVDALAWSTEAQRLFDACTRAEIEVGTVQLPAIRRGEGETRWARLDEIYDWNDADFHILTGSWIVRACAIPMLRRGLGQKRLEALHAFVDESDFHLEAGGAEIAEWGSAYRGRFDVPATQGDEGGLGESVRRPRVAARSLATDAGEGDLPP